jgi:Cyclic nucleotide-binding domain/4Fe-4S binding domain
MLGQIAERRMHWVRWVITSAWLLLIGSLLYDPISPWLTQPDAVFSPLRIDPTRCVQVQGVCLQEQPYAIGATIFWGAVVPSSIFILLIFGHELWRRICPLSALSQIPRALGWQRQIQRGHEKTGKVRFELAKVKADSWLGRNYLYLQLGLLYIGLCARILFINSDRRALAAWFIITIAAAITVGYLYGGKAWCQYFCPMAPVQKVYSEPGGLFGSKAHIGDQAITQSMCRTVDAEGKEQSACVACQNPCIDIDAERSYWDGMQKPEQKVLYYGYLGLVVGYFVYYYLYAGNWDYYFSGAWAHQENQLETLLNPGWYVFETAIPVPKIVAVPLTLGAFSGLGYGLGMWIERRYQTHLHRTKQPVSPELRQHRIFTVCTFVVFNFFFIFGGRPLILLLPLALQFFYEGIIVGLSTLWLYRTWQRNPDRYTRESLASRLRRQLGRLQLDVAQFIAGRSLDDLSTDEVYVLAKVLPGFSHEKRHQAYKGVLREALEEGYVNTSSSLQVLQQMRAELAISDEEHRLVLEELGVEDPQLLDPHRQRSLENQVRLTGYRKALERALTLRQRQVEVAAPPTPQKSIQALLENEPQALRALRREYSVTVQEAAEILDNLDPTTQILRRADFLLQQLATLINCYRALNQPVLHQHQAVLQLLCAAVKQKKHLLVTGLLEILEHLEHEPAGEGKAAMELARSLNDLSPGVLVEILAASAAPPNDPHSWHRRLSPTLIQQLSEPGEVPLACSLDLAPSTIANHLHTLLNDPNPVIQAVSLYLLAQISDQSSQAQALLNQTPVAHPLVQEVAQTLIKTQSAGPLSAFGGLEKLVYLCTSDFFGGVHSETLIELANRAVVSTYETQAVITEAGDTCRELLLLIEGTVQIQRHCPTGEVITESLRPGYVLDELEVLSHAELSSTIVAQVTPTRILAIPVDTLDDLLDRDHDFARRVLEMESRRLQQVLHG